MTRAKYSALDLLEDRIIDPNAVTITELCKAKGIDRNMAYIIRNEMLEKGLWEKVYKINAAGKITEAYRLSRKGRAEVSKKRKETGDVS